MKEIYYHKNNEILKNSYYQKIFYSLQDLSNRSKTWRKEYNNFSMRPLGWFSPKKFCEKMKMSRRIT